MKRERLWLTGPDAAKMRVHRLKARTVLESSANEPLHDAPLVC